MKTFVTLAAGLSALAAGDISEEELAHWVAINVPGGTP